MIRADGENRPDKESAERAASPQALKNKYIARGSGYITIAVAIAERIHLFSYRTQKLSSLAPKVLEEYPPGG